MSFVPTISNPIKNNIPATEILLNDRLITNNELKKFFIGIPQRLDVIERADDVSDNIDVLALTDDVEKNKEDITKANDAIDLINDNVTEIEERLGDTHISGTVTYRLKEIVDLLYGTDNLIEYVIGVEETALDLKNEELPTMQAAIDAHETNITTNMNSINILKQQVLTLENLCTQIDVNTSNIGVLNSLVTSINSQIEQVRFEMNNTLASFENRLKALENK